MKKELSYQDYLKEQMKDPEFAKLWEGSQQEIAFRLALIEAREEKGLTQKELADLVGMKQTAISRIERGDTNPTIATLDRIARGLNRVLEIKFSAMP